MDAVSNREFYAFRNPDNGQLVRVREQGHEYRLSSYDSDPVFEVATPEELALVLFENTPGYNSRRDCPGWGMFSREQLVPVKVVTRTAVEPFELSDRRVSTLSTRSIPYVVARRYAGGDLAGVMPDALVAFWLVELPKGMTLADALRWEGQLVAADDDKYLRRTLYKALAVPEDYQSELAGKNAALFLASTL